jgi:FtsP/CotA-like multicopper oxidase with cupredoxin domain
MNVVDPAGGPAPNFYVIGTDGGYLDAPVMVKKLTMMPGERYEVILDFSVAAPGARLLIKNTAKTPFPAGAAPQGATLGRVMQFRVGACTSGQCGVADTSFNPAAAGATIRAAGEKIVRLPGTGGTAIVTAAGPTQNVQKTRGLTLNEVMGMPQLATDPVTGVANTPYPGGPLEILVNNTKWGGKRINGVSNGHFTFEPVPGFTGVTLNGDTTYYSELPQEGSTEIWEIINLTADAHPIHLHLVQFQLISRQSFNVNAYNATYFAAFPGGGWDPMLNAACAVGAFCPGFGPPLDYDPSTASGGKYGGNPDVAAIGGNGKPLYLSGKPAPPAANEAGWKDTVIVYPGQVTRIAVRWAPTDLPVKTTGQGLGSLYYPFDPSGGFTMDGSGNVLTRAMASSGTATSSTMRTTR